MISVILLAAGQSKRMHGKNKLTKKYNNIALINHSVKNILESNIDELIIVLGHQSKIIKKIINKNKKIKFIFNKDYKSGMSSSIKAGLKHISTLSDYFFISLGDMPLINKDVYNLLLKYRKNHDLIIPTFNKQQGNPVLFSKKMKKEFLKINGDIGARKIIKFYKKNVIKIKISNSSILKNFNTKDSFN